MAGRSYHVYIMTNAHNTVLYTGVTNDLQRRMREHRSGRGGAFTSRRSIRKLVYYEASADVRAAKAREKHIKRGSRQKKVDLVESMNPEWKDLYGEPLK